MHHFHAKCRKVAVHKKDHTKSAVKTLEDLCTPVITCSNNLGLPSQNMYVVQPLFKNDSVPIQLKHGFNKKAKINLLPFSTKILKYAVAPPFKVRESKFSSQKKVKTKTFDQFFETRNQVIFDQGHKHLRLRNEPKPVMRQFGPNTKFGPETDSHQTQIRPKILITSN